MCARTLIFIHLEPESAGRDKRRVCVFAVPGSLCVGEPRRVSDVEGLVV